MGTIKLILDQIQVERTFEEASEELEEENKDEGSKKRFEDKEVADKCLLKTALYALIGNLCTEKTLRL